jgi:nitrate reductase NapE component
MARTFITAPMLLILVVATASAQSQADDLRTRLEPRFEIVPIANGIVLTPRFRTSIKSVEVSEATIAIDGAPVTGRELRERLGNDADLVLQASYLDAAARRSLAAGKTPPPKPVDPTTPTLDPGSIERMEPQQPRSPRARRREDIIRIGGSVTVDSDEFVRGDVVVVGGSASINGEVDGEVVVVGGSARFGPQADVRGDITVIGGGLSRDPSAVIRGAINEVGFGDIPWRGEWGRHADWDWMNGIYPVARLTGTLVRITLLFLLTTLVLFVAKTPVEQIADRVAADPVKSWFVGFLAEMLFIPVLIMTAFVLAISIIGIPLLVLLPVAIVALLVVMLVGFTAVAYHVGRLLQDKVDALRTRPYAATFVGILLIVSPVLLARLVGLAGGLGFVVWPIAAVGFLLEYSVWTAGLGAAALVRFNRPAQPPSAAITTTTVAT